QHGGGHQLSGLAVSALGHLLSEPRALKRMSVALGEPFDGGDPLSLRPGEGRDARANCVSLETDGAGATLSDTAAKFVAGEPKGIWKDPQQRGARVHIGDPPLAVENQLSCLHRMLHLAFPSDRPNLIDVTSDSPGRTETD